MQAFVPLGEMFGYATDLRSSTQGRATYTMQFERYEQVPNNIAEEIVEHRAGEPVGAASDYSRRVSSFPGSPAGSAKCPCRRQLNT